MAGPSFVVLGLMSLEEMYNVTQGNRSVWGIAEYQTPKKYITKAYNQVFEDYDPATKKKKPKKIKQGKIDLNAKRGDIYTEILKQQKDRPGPGARILFI
jgi:hypothetical protein